MNTLKQTAAATKIRSFYARVAALGYGLIAFTGLIALGLSVATSDFGQGLAFALVFLVVGLLVASLVWRMGTWALVLAAVLALALLVLIGPFSVFSLIHPESAADFVPILLALVGALLGLVGSAGALVQARRKTIRPDATGGERLALGGFLALVAVASLLSIVLTLANRTALSTEAKAGATGVQMTNYQFAPTSLPVKAGDMVRLAVKNNDPTLHSFTLPQAGIDISVPPGSERLVTFKAPAAGAYQWYCIPHSDEAGATRTGMVGSLVVQ